MDRRVFGTIGEAIEYLISDEPGTDIIIALPPDVDVLTDEEEINEGEIALVDASLITGKAEIFFISEALAEPEYPPSKKKKIELDPKWSGAEPSYTTLPPPGDADQMNRQKMINSLNNEITPVGAFQEFFNQEVYDLIVSQTVKYATTNRNKPDFNVSGEDIKTFIGFLIFSGYHRLPNERDYWSEQEDLGCAIVREAMSRNTYLEIKSAIHFQDNALADNSAHDRSFKIKPLLDILNKNYTKWGIYNKHLSIDEMIVHYNGQSCLKTVTRNKPVRVGYKLWAMCGETGYCYYFSLYCGTESSEKPEPLGSVVVKEIISKIEDPSSHILYFGNFFTTYPLLDYLRTKGIRASGAIPDNWTNQCPIKSPEEVVLLPRGSWDHKFDENNEILILRWNDGRCVSIGTNFDFIQPAIQVQRWNKYNRSKIMVPQPTVVNNYNKYVITVNQHDLLSEKYSISVKGKKWYWCLFTRMIDISVANAYILYQEVHGKGSISIKDFRRSIAVAYLKIRQGRELHKPKSANVQSTSKNKVFDDVRFDGRDHFLCKRSKQRRCQYTNCNSKPLTYCNKCQVTLCTRCFPLYHEK